MTPLPFTVDLFAVPEAVPEMRRMLRWRFGDVDVPDLALCVSGTSAGRVRVELSDPAPGLWPAIRIAGSGDECGRGLLLVDAFALRWGVEQGPYTKAVWCELRAPVRSGPHAHQHPASVGS